MNQELINYVREKISRGVAKEQIRQELFDKGWKEHDIEVAFTQLGLSSQPVSSGRRTETRNETPVVPADYVKRVLAGIIDIFLVSTVPSILLLTPLNLILKDLPSPLRVSLITIITLTIFIGYFISLTAIYGQTIGKKILGLKVTSLTGGKVNWIQVLFRETIGKFISFTVFNLGFIWIFIDDKGRGWHDKLAQTQVIDTKPQEAKVSPIGIVIAVALGLFILVIAMQAAFFASVIAPQPKPLLSRVIPLELVPDIKIPVEVLKLRFILPYLTALFPLALYLSRKTRIPIIALLLIYQSIQIPSTIASLVNEANFERFKKQQIAFTTEKLTTITKGYLLTNPPENWSEPSISWSQRGNTEYVSIGYLYKIEDYIERNLDRTSEGRILLTEFENPTTALKCDPQTFQEIEVLNSSLNPKNGSCAEFNLNGIEAIIIKNKWITYQNIQNVETTLIVFDKDDTRIHLLYEDYSKGEKSLSRDRLISLANNLRPMTEDDIKKYGAIEDYLKLLERRRR